MVTGRLDPQARRDGFEGSSTRCDAAVALLDIEVGSTPRWGKPPVARGEGRRCIGATGGATGFGSEAASRSRGGVRSAGWTLPGPAVTRGVRSRVIRGVGAVVWVGVRSWTFACSILGGALAVHTLALKLLARSETVRVREEMTEPQRRFWSCSWSRERSRTLRRPRSISQPIDRWSILPVCDLPGTPSTRADRKTAATTWCWRAKLPVMHALHLSDQSIGIPLRARPNLRAFMT